MSPRPPGTWVVVSNAADLEAAIASAASLAAALSLFVQPQATIRLQRALVISGGINVTVASSGAGATIDGLGASRLFEIVDGRLELWSLNLANGFSELPASATGRRLDESSETRRRLGHLNGYSGACMLVRSGCTVALHACTVRGCESQWDGENV